MFSLIYCKRLVLVASNCKYMADSTTHLSYLLYYVPVILIRPFSSSTGAIDYGNKHEKKQQKQSFPVSYLINTCGLSPESAVSVSKIINFTSPQRPNSVLRLFLDYGFTNTQISKLVKQRPTLLLADPEKTLLPKLQFLQSIGVSRSDIVKIICRNPSFLGRSMQIIFSQCHDFLESFTTEGVDAKVIQLLKRSSWGFVETLQSNVVTNVSILKEHGVPQSIIFQLVTFGPTVLSLKVDNFTDHVKKVIEMGVNPLTTTFFHALLAYSGMSKSTWENKMEIYRKWGWSDNEIQLAFKKHPVCLQASEKKIMSVMGFLVNKMGWQPLTIARCPCVLCYSLEKRIIPRCSVIRVLLQKCLIREEIPLSSVLTSTKKCFLHRFVTKYLEEVPQLLNIFEGKTDILELGFGFEETSSADVISM